jgi:hypothetical protein
MKEVVRWHDSLPQLDLLIPQLGLLSFQLGLLIPQLGLLSFQLGLLIPQLGLPSV